MKPRPPQRSHAGFSMVDLMIMAATVAVVVIVLLPMLARPRATTQRITCVNNLKQLGLSYRVWAGDNNDRFPAHVSTNLGGVAGLDGVDLLIRSYEVMSNELATPKILVCPDDSARKWATNFGVLRTSNLSYFTVPEADDGMGDLWVSGDRNLSTNGVAVGAGRLRVTTNSAPGWTAAIHKHKGNVGLADGSVRQLTSAALFGSMTNALAATSNGTFQILIP